MKHSTFLFYLIAFPGFAFIAFFFNHATALFPLLSAFLNHVCYGWSSFIYLAPAVMAETFFVLFLFFSAVLWFFTKICFLFFTAWKIHHLKMVRNVEEYSQFILFQKLHHKIILFSSKTLTAFCYLNTIYLSSALFKRLNAKEIEAVFLHEYQHARNFDSLKIWLLELINKCFIFPLFTTYINEFKLALEIEADSYVQVIQGTNFFLKRALSKVISYPNLEVSQFSSYKLGDRIQALKENNFSSKKINLSPLLGIFFALFLAVLFLHQAKMALAMTELRVHHQPYFCVNNNDMVIPISSLQNYSALSH